MTQQILYLLEQGCESNACGFKGQLSWDFFLLSQPFGRLLETEFSHPSFCARLQPIFKANQPDTTPENLDEAL